MTKTWWWVRHAPVTCFGEKIYGQMDLPCLCEDHALFDQATARLPPEAHWATTPLMRTGQTQQGLLAAAKRLGLPRRVISSSVEPTFAEQHLGQWQGRTRDEIDKMRNLPRPAHWLGEPNECPAGGESFLQLAQRVRKGIDALQGASGPEHIVVIAHAGTIRAALMHALALQPHSALRGAIGNCTVVRLTLVYDGSQCTGQLRL